MVIAIISGGDTSFANRTSAQSAAAAITAALAGKAEVRQYDFPSEHEKFVAEASEIDCAIPCFYPYCKEGEEVQKLLREQAVPFVFSDSKAHNIARDRLRYKEVMTDARMQLPHYHILRSPEDAIGTLPVVISVVDKQQQSGNWPGYDTQTAREMVNAAFGYGDVLMAEQQILGKKYSVIVLDGTDGTKALPVIELVAIPEADRTHFDDPWVEYVCPAAVNFTLAKALQNAAMRAHAAIGARHFSTSVFVVDPNGVPRLLQTDVTLVGDAMYYEILPALAAARLEFGDVIQSWIATAQR